MANRDSLETFLNQDIIVSATFKKYDTTRDGRTVALFLDVHLLPDKIYLADHVWISRSSAMKKLELEEGDEVSFESQVIRYAKGSENRGWEESFGLKSAKDIRKI